MNSKIITSFLILSIILVVPQVSAQTESLSNANQKSVQVTIDNDGNVKVVHQIANSNKPTKGMATNLSANSSRVGVLIFFSGLTVLVVICPISKLTT